MSLRTRSTLVLARRRLVDAFVSPGFYVAMCLSLLLAYVAITSFVGSVDSSGFNYHLSPFYNVVGGLLTGAFGDALLASIFAQGPFLFALHAAFAPLVFYLALASVFRYGAERSSGALELYTYGPTDATAYFLASVAKDALLALVGLGALLVFFAVSASVENLALTPSVFVSAGALFLMAIGVYAYGVFVSVCTDNGGAAISLYFVVLALFGVLLVGSFAIVGARVGGPATVLAATIGWLSPLSYWSLFERSYGNADNGALVAAVAGQLALASVLLAGSHFIARARGVRA